MDAPCFAALDGSRNQRVIYQSKKGCMRDLKCLKWKLTLDFYHLNNNNEMKLKIVTHL